MTTMNTYHQPVQGFSWKDCIITSETDLDAFAVKPLVKINGQPIVREHEATYLTGRDTCRAHHFAKLLAASVLSGCVEHGPRGDKPDSDTAPADVSMARRVLWIDTVNGPRISAGIYRELSAHATGEDQLHIFSLDELGSNRYYYTTLMNIVKALVHNLNPALIVIDDIDHFMPNCGVNTATGFCSFVRDITQQTDAAFVFIGYNHLGKRASTTGNLGKYLFNEVANVFSLTTQSEVTTVRLYRSYDLSLRPDETQYHFTVGPDNLPCDAPKPADDSCGMDDATLRTVISDILKPGESISPDELLKQVNIRLKQLKRQRRSLALLEHALQLGILAPANPADSSTPLDGETPGDGIAGLPADSGPLNPSAERYTLISSEMENNAKENLTLPPPSIL